MSSVTWDYRSFGLEPNVQLGEHEHILPDYD